MKKSQAMLLSFIALNCVCFQPASAFAQAGVCNRATDDAKKRMDGDVAAWKAAINATDQPRKVKDAYIVLFEYNRDNAYKEADNINAACTQGFKPYQDIMDAIVAYYTLGLSKVLQPAMTHVDVSELLAGYPLGGPRPCGRI